MGRPGTLRIIAGAVGGIRLAYPKEIRIRPTADRVREAIFNILLDRVQDARVLDLFAGTGAFGIEALSRGAAECTFVENHRACIASIRENLRKTGFAERARLIAASAFAFPGERARIQQPFDLIFIDPPYHLSQDCAPSSKIAQLVARLSGPALLAPGGIIILEHASNANVPDELGPAKCVDHRQYGSTGVSFFSGNR